jgi:hypothetical protein
MWKLYRVENPSTDLGLWYSAEGELTEFIKTLEHGQCRNLPMPHDPRMKDGGDWLSACDNLPDMRHWFSEADLRELDAKGYRLFEIEVTGYRHASGHAIFLRSDVITSRRLHMKALLTTSKED